MLLAAVHHGELATAPAREVIDALTGAGLVDAVVEVTEQPPLDPAIDRQALLRWRGRQRVLERQWRAYLGTDRPWSSALGHGGQALFRVRLETVPSFAEKAWRARQVESFVTAKHIAAWRRLADGPQDLLLVLESDAALTPDSVADIRAVGTAARGSALYVNLAGGLDGASIGIGHLHRERIGDVVRLAKPVTNTSCAYLVDRGLVTGMLDFLDRNPGAARLGIDWLVNAYFLDAEQRDASITCLHADPPVLLHGSLTGVTRSWHPDR